MGNILLIKHIESELFNEILVRSNKQIEKFV